MDAATRECLSWLDAARRRADRGRRQAHLLATSAGLLVGVAAGWWVDYLLPLPAAFRALILAATLAAVGLCLLRVATRPLASRLATAFAIERRHPALRERLSSLVQLADRPVQPLVESLAERTLADVRLVEAGTRFRPGTSATWRLGVVALAGAMAAGGVGWVTSGRVAARGLLPWADVPWAWLSDESPRAAARGQPYRLRCRVHGHAPAWARIAIEEAGTAHVRVVPVRDDGVIEHEFTCAGPWRYRVEARDAWLARDVPVLEKPVISAAGLRIEIEPPLYVRRARTTLLATTAIEAPAGSVLRVGGRARPPLERIDVEDWPAAFTVHPIRVEADETFCSFAVELATSQLPPGRHVVTLRGVDANGMEARLALAILLQDDPPPRVELRAAGVRWIVTPGAADLAVDLLAEDLRHGLSELHLVWARGMEAGIDRRLAAVLAAALGRSAGSLVGGGPLVLLPETSGVGWRSVLTERVREMANVAGVLAGTWPAPTLANSLPIASWEGRVALPGVGQAPGEGEVLTTVALARDGREPAPGWSRSGPVQWQFLGREAAARRRDEGVRSLSQHLADCAEACRRLAAARPNDAATDLARLRLEQALEPRRGTLASTLRQANVATTLAASQSDAWLSWLERDLATRAAALLRSGRLAELEALLNLASEAAPLAGSGGEPAAGIRQRLLALERLRGDLSAWLTAHRENDLDEAPADARHSLDLLVERLHENAVACVLDLEGSASRSSRAAGAILRAARLAERGEGGAALASLDQALDELATSIAPQGEAIEQAREELLLATRQVKAGLVDRVFIPTNAASIAPRLDQALHGLEAAARRLARSGEPELAADVVAWTWRAREAVDVDAPLLLAEAWRLGEQWRERLEMGRIDRQRRDAAQIREALENWQRMLRRGASLAARLEAAAAGQTDDALRKCRLDASKALRNTCVENPGGPLLAAILARWIQGMRGMDVDDPAEWHALSEEADALLARLRVEADQPPLLERLPRQTTYGRLNRQEDAALEERPSRSPGASWGAPTPVWVREALERHARERFVPGYEEECQRYYRALRDGLR